MLVLIQFCILETEQTKGGSVMSQGQGTENELHSIYLPAENG